MSRRFVHLSIAFAVIVTAALVSLAPARAGADPREFRVNGIYVGMSEAELQRVAGELERVKQTDSAEIDENPRLELFCLKKNKDVFVGIDKDSRNVAVVMGPELARDDRTLIRAGEYQFRIQLILMPMQHDDSWVYHNDKVDLAFIFVIEASKTKPVIYRVVLSDPSLTVKGGWLGGVDPRPGPRNDGGTQWR